MSGGRNCDWRSRLLRKSTRTEGKNDECPTRRPEILVERHDYLLKVLIRDNPRDPRPGSCSSHAIIIRPAPTFRRDPGNNLVRVLNIASLAMHAIRRIQADPFPIRR